MPTGFYYYEPRCVGRLLNAEQSGLNQSKPSQTILKTVAQTAHAVCAASPKIN